MGGIVALALLLLLGLLIGRLIATRVLGEQEPLTVLGFSVIIGISVLGYTSNLVLRMARIEIALPIVGVLLLAGYVVLRRLRCVAVEAPPRLTWPERAAAIAACLAGVVPIVILIYWTDVDEAGAHLPWATMLSKGVYPPRHVELQECVLGYHFAYDLIAGLAKRLIGRPMDEVFDVLSTVLCISFFLTTGGLIRRYSGSRALPWILMVGILLMGGTYWIRALLDPSLKWVHRGTLDGYELLAPTTGYFLQKPMLMGLAVLPLVIALYFAAEERQSVARAAVAGVALAFLELCEYPLFVLAVAATVAFSVAMPVLERKLPSRRTMWTRLVFIGTGVVLALLNGGFLSRSNRMEAAIDIAPHIPFFQATNLTQGSPWWQYLWQFGVPVLVAPIATYWTIRSRRPLTVWLLLLAWGSFAIPHLLAYSVSNDGTKTFNFARIGFVLVFMMHLAERLKSSRRAVVLAAVAPLLIALSGDGVMRLRYYASAARPFRMETNPDESLRMDYEAAQWLTGRAGVYDKVLTYDYPLSTYGGIFSYIVWFAGRRDTTATVHFCDAAQLRFVEKHSKLAMADLNGESLSSLGVRWIYLTEKELARLGDKAKDKLNARPFKLVYNVQRGRRQRLIYEYLEGPPRRDRL